jgi:hypothetical protein
MALAPTAAPPPSRVPVRTILATIGLVLLTVVLLYVLYDVRRIVSSRPRSTRSRR